MKLIIPQLQHNQITLAGAQLEVSSISSYCEAVLLTGFFQEAEWSRFLIGNR